jgi:glycosyltransferase involved in cell wall biosynthesis
MTRGLAKRGIRVRAITAHPHYPEWRIAPGFGAWSQRDVSSGVHVHRVRHYVPNPPTGLRRLLSELSFGARTLLDRWGDADVYVLVSPALFAACLQMARIKITRQRTPVVVWVQDLYGLGMKETGQGAGLVGRIAAAVERWLLRKSDSVVVIHERFARRVARDYDIPTERIHVVRNWTHLTSVPALDRAATRLARGWGDETVVLHAGNMGLKQGLDNVVEAARLADTQGAHVRFALVGEGGQRERLQASAAGVQSIDFIDPLPDEQFASVLRAADVLLVNERPGVAEMAVPSKLTSYFSTGLPVLAATDESGITAEEIRTAAAGVVVPAGAPQMLLDAALALSQDREAAIELGKNGQRFRATVLDETQAIDRFASLLQLLVDGGHEQRDAQTASLSPLNGASID